MEITTVRKKLSIVLLAVGLVLTISYSLAAYLVFKQRGPATAPEATAPAARGLPELLASAEDHLNNKRVEQALVDYREALSLNPQSIYAQLGLARGELQAGREAIAAREYERALSLDDKNQTALLELARIYAHQSATWPQSENHYRQYLALAPNDPQASLGLARVLAWQRKAKDAVELFGKPEVTSLMTTTDQRDYAFALMRLGNDKQAEPVLRKLLASSPGDTELSLQLASVYASRKDWASALPIYRGLLAKKPGDPNLNLHYGLGLLSMKDYKAALGPLAKARNAMPSNGEAGIAYARAIKGSGDLKRAVKEYERVVPLFPRSAPVLREYADVLLEKRDFRKSAEYYKQAYSLGLRDNRLLGGYAGALNARGDYKTAVPILEDLHRREPSERVTFELAKALSKTGRGDRAKELLRQIDNSRASR